jgi:hypothetical protein
MNTSKRLTLATAVAALFSTVSCSNMSSNTVSPGVEYTPVSNNCPNGCGINTCCQITPQNIAIAARLRSTIPNN